MADPRRSMIRTGGLSMQPGDAPERWQLRADRDESAAVEASWGDWVRLARRILDADALSRDLEARGDAWDQGHAAGSTEPAGGEAVNPYR